MPFVRPRRAGAKPRWQCFALRDAADQTVRARRYAPWRLGPLPPVLRRGLRMVWLDASPPALRAPLKYTSADAK